MRRISAQRSERYVPNRNTVVMGKMPGADSGTFVPPPPPPPPRRLTFLEKMTHMPLGQAITAVIATLAIAAFVIVNIPLHPGDFIASIKEAKISSTYSDATVGKLYDKFLTGAKYKQSGGTFFSKYVLGDPDLYITLSGKLDGYAYTVLFKCVYSDGEYTRAGRVNKGYVPNIERGEFNGHELSGQDAELFQGILLVAYENGAEHAVEFLEDTADFDPDNPAALFRLLHALVGGTDD